MIFHLNQDKIYHMLTAENFNGIRAFVAAEAAGSFAAASLRLGLSQSAVSKAVARLEARLGVRLFQRSTRHLTLTDEGRIYLQSCQRALQELAFAEAALSERGDQPVGEVRISLPELYGRHVIMPLLLQLAARHAQLRFSISFENRRSNLVEEGFDLAVRIGSLPDSSELMARLLGRQQLLVCAAPDYLDRYGAPQSADDLRQHRCIAQLQGENRAAWLLLDKQGREQDLALPAAHAFSASDVIADAAVAGLGLAQLPRWLVEQRLQSGALRQVLADVAMPALPIHILWPRNRALPSRLRRTIDWLVENAAQAC